MDNYQEKQTYRAQGLDPVANAIGYTGLQICQRHIPQSGLQRPKQFRALVDDSDRTFVGNEAHARPIWGCFHGNMFQVDQIARLRANLLESGNLGFHKEINQEWVGNFAPELGHESRVVLIASAVGEGGDVLFVDITNGFCSIPHEEEGFVFKVIDGDDTDDLAKEIW